MSTLDQLLSGGTKSAKFDRPGDSITGTIVSLDTRQATEFGTGKPLTFDNGDPRQQIVITLQTDQREDADDDGRRVVYSKAWGPQLKAFRAAANASGKPEIGDTFTATYVGDGERSPQGGFPPKMYSYDITKNTGVDALIGSAPAAQPEHVPTPASAPAGESIADKVQKLIQSGLTDDQIKQVTGADTNVIAALRGSSKPF